MKETKLIPLNKIDKGNRARKNYKNISELAESIKTNGLIHNISVLDKRSVKDWNNHGLKPDETDPEKPYLLLVGGRRMTAYETHEISDSISAKIYNEDLTAEDIKTIELEENIQREDLTHEEEVMLTMQIHRHYQRLYGQVEGTGSLKTGHSLRDTAKRLNKSPATVSQDIKLAEAMKAVPSLFKETKNKTEAHKVLNKAFKSLDEEETAQKIRSKRAKTGPEKIKKKISDKFISKDIISGLESLPDSSVNIIELDPPLQIGFEDIYNEDTTYDGSLTEENYSEELRKVLELSFKKMKNHSWIVVWFPIEPYYPVVLNLMKEVGFKVRGIPLIWDKGSGNTRSPNYNMANNYEVAFYGRKGEPILNSPGKRNIFKFKKPSPKKRYHKTEKPIELYEEIFDTLGRKGSIVCAGYAGSGNAILAAENIDMHGVGFDTNKSLKDKFDLKVWEDVPPNYTSYNEG